MIMKRILLTWPLGVPESPEQLVTDALIKALFSGGRGRRFPIGRLLTKFRERRFPLLK